MPTKEETQRSAEKQKEEFRQALRRFYTTVDEALAAADAAKHAKRDLERLTGGLREAPCDR